MIRWPSSPERASRFRWQTLQGRSTRLWQRVTPPQMFVGSFALLILLGTVGFRTLPGLYRSEPLSWHDSVFTATSSVCVTGLSVVDISATLTLTGQAFLLLLVQLGGLGMLAFASVIIAALGRRLSLRAVDAYADTRGGVTFIDARRLTLDVVRFALALEALGAVALYAAFVPRLGWSGAAWPAVFHSVNGFCNAGFSTFSDSLIGFQQSPAVLYIVMTLIVVGGVGFITLEEVYLRLFRKQTRGGRRLSIHTRLVLISTAGMILGGWLMFAMFEWEGSLRHLSAADRANNALFMSVTARTAGFNNVNYATVSDSSNFLTILLMTIGGSPGSTAGGMKNTTFALLVVVAWSRFRGHPTTMFMGRSIPIETTQRAAGLAVAVSCIAMLGAFLLATSEQLTGGDSQFLVVMFEAVSAFNTVGLSMGYTPQLSSGGRWIVILLMFLGRVGPLMLAAALVVRHPRNSSFRYAYEDVAVG